ncbi:MAG TPA: hypothetical protein PLM09_03520 [Casimicrobiaceae bacterium]|nr:hypothetical protein [Casimicrobiaceae bacterium]
MDARVMDLPFDPNALEGLSEYPLRGHHRDDCGSADRRLNATRAR